ncbi:MAG: hypothetical protein PHQ98_03680 [Candidatus ainarchaeum sp.]|nr:hypothetical protein [Candidatus ainarchaeum sp.]
MSQLLKKKKIDSFVVVKQNCDFCKKEINLDYGCGTVDIEFGYGSKYDDERFHLDICDDCFDLYFKKVVGLRKSNDVKKSRKEIFIAKKNKTI